MIKKYLQEPLLHFLVLGGFIFLFYFYTNNGFTQEEQRIIIPQAKVDQLVYIWQKKQMRTPSKTELQEIIEGEVYNEIMSREALKLGLEREDGMIRRRLVQKMSFVFTDLAALVEPSDAELKSYLTEHKEAFMADASLSFIVQNKTILEKKYNNVSAWEVSRLWGREFTKMLFSMPVDVWKRKVPTTYGDVDVLVTEKKKQELRPFNDIRPLLKQAWQLEAQRKSEQDFYNTLKQEYVVEIGQ